ncbi:aKG-HExxH-type peptide beta-hydroxylase [Streptomyces sp. NPDC055078]
MSAGRLQPHRLPEESLRSIATGTADAPELRLLRSAQRSQLLLVLRSLLLRADAVAHRGRGGSARAAWAVLAAAEERDPGAVDAVIGDPSVMAWALRLLRRLKRLGNEAAEQAPPAPLWADLGQFHSLAAAAALHAGMTVVLRVPAHRGLIWLPGAGVAGPVARRRWSEAEIRIERAGAVVRGELAELKLPRPLPETAEGWQPRVPLALAPVPDPASVPVPDPAPEPARDLDSVPARDLASAPVPVPVPVPDTATAPAPDLGLVLDTVSPYRDLTVPLRSPTSVGERRLGLWRERITGARALLARESPAEARAVTELVRTVVPRPSPAVRGAWVASASSADAFGAVALSLPYDDVQAAAVLVHESRHQQLNALFSLVPLLSEPPGGTAAYELFYAPWRSDPRPPPGLLHGVHAFAGVAGFWRARRGFATGTEAARAHFEFAVLREQVAEGVAALLASDALTKAGRLFAAEVAGLVGGWREEVAAEPARLARHYCALRRALWRVRHREIADADASELADAWRAGRPAPALPPVVLRPRLDAIRTDTFGPLARLRLSAPRAFARPPRGADAVHGAESAAVAGDAEGALRAYAHWPADDPEAWIGSALALPAADRPPGADLLLARPETVAAVHTALIALGAYRPDPLRVAAWLDAVSPRASVGSAHPAGVSSNAGRAGFVGPVREVRR